MQPGNLLAFTKGGGGLIGKGKTSRLDNFAIVVHALKAKDGTQYPAATFMKFDINVLDDGVDEDHRHATQYLRVGRVPLWYSQQINSIDPQRDANYPGGFLPSVDGQNPTTEGPFILFDGENGIWEGEDYSIFLGELVQQGFIEQGGQDRMAKQGIACLSSIVVKLDDKAKPKGKKADPKAAAKTVMVPVQVIQWPWAAAGTPTAVAAPAAIAAPAAAAQVAAPATSAIAAPKPPAAAAAPTVVVPPAAGNGTDYDGLAIDRIKKAALAAGGMLKKEAILSTVFPLTSDLEGVVKSQVMTRVNTPAFIASAAAAGHFLIDPNGTIMVAS